MATNQRFPINARALARSVAPYLILSMAPLFWAGNVVLAQGVADRIPPMAFAFWRWLLAFGLILPFALRPLKQDRRAIARSWKMLLVQSLLGISAFNALLYSAVHTTPAINAALIQSAMPAVIVLLSLLLYRETVTIRQIGGIAVCIGGVFPIVLQGDLQTLFDLSFATGDLLMLVAVVAYGLYSALLRRRPDIHPLSFLATTFLLGAAGLFPAYLVEFAATGPFALSGGIGASILYVAIFPSILAYFCWNEGVGRVGPNRAGLFINLIPVFASLLAVWLLGASIRPYHLLGMALIAFGMAMFYFSRA